MAKYDKKAALKIMIEAVKQYEEKLNDKQFLIIYREGKDIKTVNVGFRVNRNSPTITLYT